MKSLFLYLILTAASFDMRYFQATELSQDATSRSNGVYTGTPYLDSVAAVSIQRIPGKLKCAFYDRGGEGVAYHDSDRRNNGSGGLNKGPGISTTSGWTKELTSRIQSSMTASTIHSTTKFSLESTSSILGGPNRGNGPGIPLKSHESAEYRIGALYTSKPGRRYKVVLVDNTDSYGVN